MEHSGSFDHRLLHDHRFALVAAEYRAELPSSVIAPSLCHGDLTDSAELLPGLINLFELNSRELGELTNRLEEAHAESRPPLLSALLQTGASADQVAAHIRAVQLRSGPRGERAWLRIHDPRVWAHLPRIFQRADLRAVFGPMVVWSICIGNLWVKTLPPVHANGSAGRASLRHEPAQWAALQRVGAVNRVLARNGWLSHMDIIERSQAIDDLVARGQLRHGLTDVGDLVEYAHLGMTIDPRFDELPVAVSAINAYELSLRSQDANDDASVIDELRAVSDEQWVRALREAPMEAQHDD